jgi:hypothetical protein
MNLSPDLVDEMIARGAVLGPKAAFPDAGIAQDALKLPDAPSGRPESEKAFLARVVKLAKEQGWLCFHVYDSRRCEAGFPDLTFVRERVIYAELKREAGNMTREQKDWFHALKNAGAEVYLWRPSDWSEIVSVLSRPVEEQP